MKKRFWFIAVTLFILITVGLSIWRHTLENSTVFTETLSNGLEVLILPTNSPLISIQLWVRTGAINETPKNSGISHYLEHMLFKNKQIVRALEAKGGAMNGATSEDFTYYYVTLPKNNLTNPIRSLCDLVFMASFTPTDAVQEKNVILEEMSRGNDNPDQHIYDLLNEKAYGAHPYAKKVIGTEQSVKSLTYAQLRDYYVTWYVPNNATLVIAGNIDREEVRKAVRVAAGYTPQATPAQQQRAVIDFMPNYAACTIKNLSTPPLHDCLFGTRLRIAGHLHAGCTHVSSGKQNHCHSSRPVLRKNWIWSTTSAVIIKHAKTVHFLSLIVRLNDRMSYRVSVRKLKASFKKFPLRQKTYS